MSEYAREYPYDTQMLNMVIVVVLFIYMVQNVSNTLCKFSTNPAAL